MAGDIFHSRQDFANRVALSGPDVVLLRFPALLQPVDSGDMSAGEVGYVYVVTNAGAVGRRVIAAKEGDGSAALYRAKQQGRNRIACA